MGTEDIQTLVTLAIQTAIDLDETEAQPRLQLALTVAVLGVEETTALVARAREIYEGEGMSRRDGARRTLGGTFFELVRRRSRGEAQEAAKKAAIAAAVQRREAKVAKARAQLEETLDRYRKQKAELIAARDALAQEKEAREKAERALAELRAEHAKALISATRTSAPPPPRPRPSVSPRPMAGRVYRAFDPKDR